VILMLRYARKGLAQEEPTEPGAAPGATPIPALTY
jgi:hypothetical protein